MVKQKIEVEGFKKLLLDMYKGFPNWFYREMVESVVKTEEMREELIKQGVLFRTKMDGKFFYSLGPNGLGLVSSWKNEELTSKMIKLTFVIAVLTVVLIAFTLPHFDLSGLVSTNSTNGSYSVVS